MAVKKLSVALDPAVAEAAAKAAEARGQSLSSWLTDAARRRLTVEHGRRGVADWEAEQGALTAEERAAGEALVAELLAGSSPRTP
jgi:hypothetical protein